MDDRPLPLKEFRRLDLNSEEQGVSVHKLMANAGRALAEAVRAAHKKRADAPIVLLCGKGHNGGDGFAASGVLGRWGIEHTVVLLCDHEEVRGVARGYLDLVPQERIKPWKGARKKVWQGALVVDCMLGSGIRDAPRAPIKDAIAWCQQHAGHVIACDVPSGFGTPGCLHADETVTFHARKQGMGKECGRIQVADIGIPEDAGRIGLGDLDAGFVRPNHASHKGDNGRVLVVGGGPFDGAPYYAGMGAVRAGADMVHVATTAETARTIKAWGPALLVHAVTEAPILDAGALDPIEALLDRVDALVLGCGLGTSPETEHLARQIIEAAARRDLAIVVDADGLDAIDEALLGHHGARMVVTPHKKEFEDLTDTDAADDEVAAFAAAHDVVVIRKGAVDIVAGPDDVRRCHRGHVTMTKGGTGDMLAGIVGAFLAKGAKRFDAACAATYVAGCAGEIAAGLRGHGAITADMIEAIPLVLRRLD